MSRKRVDKVLKGTKSTRQAVRREVAASQTDDERERHAARGYTDEVSRALSPLLQACLLPEGQARPEGH